MHVFLVSTRNFPVAVRFLLATRWSPSVAD